MRVGALAFLIVLAAAAVASASCDIVPSPPLTFRGALGGVDRPFARAGDWVRVVLGTGCDAASPGFATGDGAQVVTLVFRALSGERRVALLADDCGAIAAQRTACAAEAGLAEVACIRARHTVAPPGGEPIEIRSLAGIDAHNLHFRFPETDALLDPAGDGIGLAGPVAIAVSRTADRLPCDLVTRPCRQQSGLVACVDELFDADGTCATDPDPTFPSFTALPPANDFEAICTPEAGSTSPCDGTVDALQLTTDAAGNLLIPVDWRGVLFRQDLVPVLRLVRGTSSLEAFEGRGAPIWIPDLKVLKSYSPGGKALPPLFDPLQDVDGTGPLAFFGSADAPETVIRIARHDTIVGACEAGPQAGLPCLAPAQCGGGTCGPAHCTGGMADGAACGSKAECPGGECGPGLFEFRTRAALRGGPVVVRRGTCIGGSANGTVCSDDAECPGGQCAAFTLSALDPVPLDGLVQSETVNAFVLEEPLEDEDLNGDGDAVDHVVRLGARATGETRTIGDAGAEARAVARIQQPPFSFPAVAVEGDVLAFLEPEPLQHALDQNGDGDVADTLLRVFRLDGTQVTDGPVVADGLPVVNGRPLVASAGKVFFRASEVARARHVIENVSVAWNGGLANGPSYNLQQPVTPDGRYVAFRSHARNLVAFPDTLGIAQVFVRDRLLKTTRLASVNDQGQPANDYCEAPAISADGRYVVFQSYATNLDDNFDPDSEHDTYVHDLVTGHTEMVATATSPSPGTPGVPANAKSLPQNLSADGRHVLFGSAGTNLVPGDRNNAEDLFVKDRLTGHTEMVAVSTAGVQGNGRTSGGKISADGRFVIFDSIANNLVPGDTNGVLDVFLRDRVARTTTRISLDSAGRQVYGHSGDPTVSSDGRHVGFYARDALVAGDNNGSGDAYRIDVRSGSVVRVSVDSAGRQIRDRVRGNLYGVAAAPALVSGGRWAIFASGKDDFVPADTNGVSDYFLHDTVTQMTERVSVDAAGEQSAVEVTWPAVVSDDGRVVVMNSESPDFIPGDTNGHRDVFVRVPDPTDCDADLTGDCDLADTVLRVLDAESGDTRTLCPATQVAVVGAKAAFLRPEREGEAAGCPPLPRGSADGALLHLYDGAEVHDLGRHASWVGMSENWIAALVSEGEEDTVLNGDGDTDDDVVAVHPAGDPGAPWADLGLAADAAEVSGQFVAFLTPEEAQGDSSLNGDADVADRVLQVYDAVAGGPVHNTAQAAEEMVASGAGLIAFRTREASQGSTDLNGDADADDDVLQVFDAGTGTLINSGQAVTPCRLEACDPLVPYRVRDDTVTFLTLETDQGIDLNQDGDQGDLVLQVLNARRAAPAGVRAFAAAPAGAARTLAATTAGVCTQTGKACVGPADCAGGTCFVPPGGCVRNMNIACSPDFISCPLGQICQPLVGLPGQGVCYALEDPCQTNADCDPGATCNLDDVDFNRIASPLLDPDGGGLVFSGAGRCVEDSGRTCDATADCLEGEHCDAGLCQREHGSCASLGDCPPGSTCVADIALQTAADGDQDELPDAIDNCPMVSNVTQEDADDDGLGDACDVSSCGNGVREDGEPCDGADAPACPGLCTEVCVCGGTTSTTSPPGSSTTTSTTSIASTTTTTTLPIPTSCSNVLGRPLAKLGVDGRRQRGRLKAKLRLTLEEYRGEEVTLRLEDATGLRAEQRLPALLALGNGGRAWRYKASGAGVKRVTLRRMGSEGSRRYTLRVRARKWFMGTVADPRLTVTLGERCFVALGR